MNTITVDLKIQELSSIIPMIMHDNEQIELGLSAEIRPGEKVDYYEGPYEFTPGTNAQTIAIDHLMATEDIVITPIPNNYGLITYNGATITVS